MRVVVRLLVSAVTIGFLTPILLLAAPMSPASAASCTPPANAADQSTQYVSLSSKHLACKQAAKVAEAFTKCRQKNGPTGYCVKRVQKGFGCSEMRTSYGDYYSSSTTCSRSKGKNVQKVYFQYRQHIGPMPT